MSWQLPSGYGYYDSSRPVNPELGTARGLLYRALITQYQAGAISINQFREAVMTSWNYRELDQVYREIARRTADASRTAQETEQKPQMTEKKKSKEKELALRDAIITQLTPRAVIPDGVHVVSGTRTGDSAREETRDHLSVMFTRGFLSQDEFTARMNLVGEALTQPQLDVLTADLPAPEKAPPAAVPARLLTARSGAMAFIMVMAAFTATGALSVRAAASGHQYWTAVFPLDVIWLTLFLMSLRRAR